ncbi:MAG: hypothetical protein NTY02_20355, partial [Acidobacteria bacterium]|nr:hypothetical protein [Acidobacteriota bacterium]
MMELLRRTILLAGLLLGIWMYLATPPALLRFEVVDFAARYDQEFRQRRETPGQGVYERGRALAAALGDPGSVDGFIAQATEHRLIRIQGAEWERLVSELTSAATAAASAPNAAGGHARARFARTTDAPFTTVMGQIDRIRSEAGSSVSYLALGTGPATRYLEVMYVDAPASSGGPSALVHPSRPSSWIPLLIGLAGYLLIPWRRSAPAIVSVDRLPAVLVLDAIGTACASIFFALPLHLAGATASALGDDLGMTVLLWCLAGCGAALVIWAARNAAYAIHVSDSALRFSSLGGTREYLYGDIQQVRPLAAGDVPRAGVVLQLRDGRVESIPWRGLLRFPMLLDALSRHGRPLPPHTADDRTPAGAASQAAARLHGAPPRRLLSTGRVAGVAIAAVVAGAGVWYITQTRTAPTATNWQASHQQKLAATIEAAIKAPDTVTTLDLAGADFVRLPDGFDRLTSLRELSLNGSTHL